MYRKLLAFGCFTLVSFVANGSLTPDQTAYNQTRELQQQGQWELAQQKASTLHDYELWPYLEYFYLRNNLSKVDVQQVYAYRQRYADVAMTNSLEREFLLFLASKHAWQSFLDFYPTPPNSTSLKCHYYMAQLKTGHSNIAWEGARELWLYGRSQPDACDQLFNAFKQAGQLNDDLIWQRMLLAFDARQSSLMGYLGRQLASHQYLANWLTKIYRKPSQLQHIDKKRFATSDGIAVLERGLKRLAWKDTQLTYDLLLMFEDLLAQAPQTQQEIQTQLMRSIINEPTVSLLAWVDKQLDIFPNTETLERRLRLSLKEQQWSQVAALMTKLPAPAAQKEVWQYWKARSDARQGRDELADSAYDHLAQQRSYYGFLAAQQLHVPYRLNNQHETEVDTPLEKLRESESFRRVQELMALNEEMLARREWYSLLTKSSYLDQLALGELALESSWPDLAVQAAIKAKAWSKLTLRFPVAYGDLFEQFGSMRHLDSQFLLAMARQESALYSKAYSPVGARGLMQLMPATAKSTARKINFRYVSSSQLYQPEVNIRLGSAYLKELMARYQNNRYLAAAAYNAGPSSVRRWSRERGSVDADIWIETIPYKETRNYVKNVLAYHLIYAMKAGIQRPLFDAHELITH